MYKRAQGIVEIILIAVVVGFVAFAVLPPLIQVVTTVIESVVPQLSITKILSLLFGDKAKDFQNLFNKIKNKAFIKNVLEFLRMYSKAKEEFNNMILGNIDAAKKTNKYFTETAGAFSKLLSYIKSLPNGQLGKNELDLINMLVDQVEKDYNSLIGKCHDFSKTLAEQASKLAEESAKLLELSQAKAKEALKYKDIVKQKEEEKIGLQNQIDTITIQLAGLNAETANLQKSIDSKKIEYNEKQEIINNLRMQAGQFENEVKTYKQSAQEYQDRANYYLNKYDQALAEYNQTQNDYNNYKNNHSPFDPEYYKTISSYESQLQQLSNDMNNYSQQKSNWQEKANEEEAKANTSQENLTKCKQEIDKNKEIADNIYNQIQDLSDQLINKINLTTAMKNQLNTYNSEIDKCLNEIEKNEKLSDMANKDAQTFNDQSIEKNQESTKKQEQADFYKDEAVHYDQELKSLNISKS